MNKVNELLIKFYLFAENGIIISELAKRIGINSVNPKFRELMGLLLDKGIVELNASEHGNMKILRIINKKKVRKIIEDPNNYDWNLWFSYITNTRGIVAF